MTHLDLLISLRRSGVLDAADSLGIDPASTFLPLTDSSHHHYARYRWSVSLDGADGPMIHALPPEEEVGWTAWERWAAAAGGTEHRSWVRAEAADGDANRTGWVTLDTDPTDLAPRELHPPADLRDRLDRARVFAAGRIVGLDVEREILGPLDARADERYRTYRWVVIPHALAADGPVIYACPPVARSDDWPWESWYIDSPGGSLIHHVHYTAEQAGCTARWREPVGAPQRPAEILDVTWWWYDDPQARPAMVEPGHP